MNAMPNTLTSIKRVGPVYSVGILAEIGCIPNHAALAKYTVLIWIEHQSGNFKALNSRIINTYNRFLSTA